jgi:hypothetical protein
MDRMGIQSSKRLGWVVAFSALMAFYYFIPELEITDSRYVLAHRMPSSEPAALT